MKSKYVLGFLFDPRGEQVVLIRKLKPEWQKNRLNGVGGKVEADETPLRAMVREFEEEAGLVISDWREYAQMGSSDWVVWVFAATSPDIEFATSVTDEKVGLFSVAEIITGSSQETISNIPWLVSMARDSFFNSRGPKWANILY